MSVRRIRGIVALPLTIVLVTAMGPLFVVVRLLFGRRACAEVLGASLASAVLRLSGVVVDIRFPLPLPERRVVYISNHTSSIDVFTLLSLRLPRARFFMKRGAWVFPPGGIAAACIGTFFTVPQVYTEERRRLFARASAVLQKTGDAVYLSPEGTRVTTGGVGPFNKGAFHLAAALGVPMVPLYLEIPKTDNPGKSWVMTQTKVIVHALREIDTSGWRLESARAHADHVRAIFQAFEAELASKPEGAPA